MKKKQQEYKRGKVFVCTKQYLYYFLTKKGFTPYSIKPDYNNPDHVVWLYAECPRLRDAVTEYYSVRRDFKHDYYIN